MGNDLWKSSVVPVETSIYQDVVSGLAAASAGQMENRIGDCVPQATEGSSLDFARSVLQGLNDSPKWLDCRYLYDTNGSRIFERICEQPEYYLTRTEGAILAAVGLDIAARTGRVTLIELGSGSSLKTRMLLEVYSDLFGATCYSPVDISKAVLEHAEQEINSLFPDVDVDPLHGTYEEAFPMFGQRSPSMLLFLGSNLGNLNEGESMAFWEKAADNLMPDDYCLLGIDINEDVGVVNAAYNDGAGWSQAFTRNLFDRMNRQLGSSLDTQLIDHVALFNEERMRVEIFARFREAQKIEIIPLGKSIDIAAGEMIMTEISCKYRLDRLVPYLEGFGFITEQVYTDTDERFAVLLLRRV